MNKSNMTGNEIKELRLSNGLKQRECANIVGVGLRQWQKYEEGYPCKQIYLQMLLMVLRNETKVTSFGEDIKSYEIRT